MAQEIILEPVNASEPMGEAADPAPEQVEAEPGVEEVLTPLESTREPRAPVAPTPKRRATTPRATTAAAPAPPKAKKSSGSQGNGS